MLSRLGNMGDFITGRQLNIKDWYLDFELKKDALLPLGFGCYGNTFSCIHAKISIFCKIFKGTLL